MTDTIERGRWYPAPAPALDGETDDTYTNRLLGVGGVDRPYDHPRNRQCSIGYHTECSDPAGERCKCPCHTDPGSPIDLDERALLAADQLAGLYDLPHTTARRVMAETARASASGEANTPDELAAVLGRVYDSTITEGFAIDVFNIHAHYAAASGQ